ncbi:MAG: 4Fe-4S binding protein [Deltaproteobacteria bacterium]
MKEIVIISGKGGTGKTSIIAAFSSLAENKVLCDADVDAADLHLITDPEIRERHDFSSGHTASIRQDACTECGLCVELCRWHAISDDFVVNPIECEGCGVCYYFCPEKAIDFPENTCGEWYLSQTRFGPMAHARLGIAEENSGKLVTLIRQEGKKLAEKENLGLLLTDGPPGIGCPVIASLGGASAVLIVAEPTVSGRHDMEREGVKVLGRVPFDPAFTKAMVQGQTILEYDGDAQGSEAVRTLWTDLAREADL